MTNDKSGVWETGENAGANAIADENPVNDYLFGCNGSCQTGPHRKSV